mmetsp:Transcript_25306/g.75983  ORF Transcript_25306/g.75983 Transcript_25306/m.75983 type:complete len:259 (+) Transcript_25306:569-1345(+)
MIPLPHASRSMAHCRRASAPRMAHATTRAARFIEAATRRVAVPRPAAAIAVAAAMRRAAERCARTCADMFAPRNRAWSEVATPICRKAVSRAPVSLFEASKHSRQFASDVGKSREALQKPQQVHRQTANSAVSAKLEMAETITLFTSTPTLSASAALSSVAMSVRCTTSGVVPVMVNTAARRLPRCRDSNLVHQVAQAAAQLRLRVCCQTRRGSVAQRCISDRRACVSHRACHQALIVRESAVLLTASARQWLNMSAR